MAKRCRATQRKNRPRAEIAEDAGNPVELREPTARVEESKIRRSEGTGWNGRSVTLLFFWFSAMFARDERAWLADAGFCRRSRARWN
jgi:hypothetical protein